MISKALLSEVLKERIIEVYKIGSNSNFKQNTLLFKLYGSGELCHINIYELAHKCKEWAKSKGFFILSGYDNTETPEAIINHIYSESGCYCDESFEAETEHQAIFKACQWILDKDSK